MLIYLVLNDEYLTYNVIPAEAGIQHFNFWIPGRASLARNDRRGVILFTAPRGKYHLPFIPTQWYWAVWN